MGFNDENKKTPAQEMENFKEERAKKRNDRRDDNDYEERGSRRRQEMDTPNSDPFAMMSKFRSPVSAITGNSLEKFSTPAKEFIETYHKQFSEKWGLSLDIVLADPDATRVRLESVIFVATIQKSGHEVETMVYTMFLQPSTNIGTQYTEGERGRSGLSFSAVASDAYTKDFQNKVEDLIKLRPGNKGNFIHIGAATIPATYDLNKEEKVRNLIREGINVIYYHYADMYQKINNFALVDLFPKSNRDDADYDRRGRRREDEVVLNSNVVFKPDETLDVFELPHSADLSVEISLGRRHRDKDRPRNALSLEENQTLAKLSANVDLLYLGEEDDGGRRHSGRNHFRRRRREEDAVAIYGLALNITSLTTEGRDVMGIQLTALANIPLLIKESVLTQALLPAPDEVRLRDPRALALEQPESFPADLITEHPTDDEWSDLMEAILQEDSTYIFLHVPRTGVHSQLLSLLVDACDPYSETANTSYKLIVDGLNVLTNNEYGRILGGQEIEFGELEVRQSFTGYWNDDRTGERRDCSPIGYFNYLTRFGQQHPEYLDIYTRCFEGEGDTQECNARMEELLSAYTGKGYTIIDRNDVVRINPEWVSLIGDALRDSGVIFDAEGLQTERGRRRPLSNTFSTGDMRSNLFRKGRSRERGRRW